MIPRFSPVLLAAFLIGTGSMLAQQHEIFTVESVTEIDAGMPVSAPHWSPDGKWIAFSAPKGNGIGIVRPEGSGRRLLTAEAGSGYQFSWSPDATRIVFRAARKEAGPRRYVIRVLVVATGEIESTSEVVRDAQPPVWQRGPAGMRWVSHGASGPLEGAWRGAGHAAKIEPPRLIARERKAGGATALNPVWSEDGGRLAFDSSDQIAVATATEPGRKLCVGNHPAWSPDGKWLVFQITRDHSHAPDDARQHAPDTAPHLHDDKTNHRIVDSDLWIIGADGAGRHQLTATADVMEVEPDWSPDGMAIVCREEETGRLLVLKIGRR